MDAEGCGKRGAGFRGREEPRAAPAVPLAMERCGGEGMRGGCVCVCVEQGRCKSLKLKQGPAASWGAVAVCAPVS